MRLLAMQSRAFFNYRLIRDCSLSMVTLIFQLLPTGSKNFMIFNCGKILIIFQLFLKCERTGLIRHTISAKLHF